MKARDRTRPGSVAPCKTGGTLLAIEEGGFRHHGRQVIRGSPFERTTIDCQSSCSLLMTGEGRFPFGRTAIILFLLSIGTRRRRLVRRQEGMAPGLPPRVPDGTGGQPPNAEGGYTVQGGL